MNPTILYEDANLAVLNKPAGLMVHGDGRSKEKTLTDWLLEKYPEIEKVGEPLKLVESQRSIRSKGQLEETKSETTLIYRPGIVHRLDKDTTGAIIIAKNQETFLFLKNQFKERTIIKNYHVFVYGKIKEMRGVIDRPIGRSNKDFRMWSAQRGARGDLRKAVTIYRVISQNKDFTFVEATPKTGRTHQIRVHFKAINHPVVCDKLYSPKKEAGLGFTRLALHAFQIKFKNLEGKLIEVEAPYPADFKEAIKILDPVVDFGAAN